jgi:murein DD-endopeptidase MepM/ murein hydrolase activator NlpD
VFHIYLIHLLGMPNFFKMNKLLFFLLLVVSICSKAQKIDKNYIYWLPYKTGKTHRVIQGHKTWFSHKGKIAIDFGMPVGTLICAARDGRVFNVKENSNRRGVGEKFNKYGNHIFIKHSDSTYAVYYHLKKWGAYVKDGDWVKKSQVIGVSGFTGNTIYRHLHFAVKLKVKEGVYSDVLVKFLTKQGIVKKPKFWRKYTCIH